ncbi:ATP-binding protein [Pedobacter psychrodurus]|uniref:AAA family ATPase n=1 Tax=Pedobacter psychrodurus TaxID=2530456 RepID=UPI00292E6549|nr:ATP-binding protein [Pedobacter psychrodurus]
MKKEPIYIKSISLQNVKTFGEETSLNLEKRDGTLSQWTLILGDNSIGKSTLLQCLAWMKPLLPDDKEDISSDFTVAPKINDEENETLINLVKKNNQNKISGVIKATFVAQRKLNRKSKSENEITCSTDIRIDLITDNDGNRKLDDVQHHFNTDYDKFFFKNDAEIICYSALRTLGKQNINAPDMEDTIRQFISERTELYDANEILHTANYARLGAKNKERKKHTKFLKDVKKMLVSLLPDIQNIEDIEVLPPRMVNGKLIQEEIMITTRHGKRIPFSSFSLGYKTTVSWTVDLAWRLFNLYPKSENPLKEPAIVIIDELDLHLHPVWQRRIMTDLSAHFPAVQFIATAHSPLMVQASFNANHAILRFEDETVEIENEPEGIDGWRVDQILTSEFFGLKSARGIAYEKLNDERIELISKENPNERQKKRIAQLNRQIAKLPTAETPAEIKDRAFMQDFVSKVKQRFKG